MLLYLLFILSKGLIFFFGCILFSHFSQQLHLTQPLLQVGWLMHPMPLLQFLIQRHSLVVTLDWLFLLMQVCLVSFLIKESSCAAEIIFNKSTYYLNECYI